MAYTKAAHHRGTYQRRAEKVVAKANADPATTCRRCGLTLAQRRLTHPDDRWTAGHVNAGEVNGELVPEHRSCNCSAGATYGNRLRNAARRATTLDW